MFPSLQEPPYQATRPPRPSGPGNPVRPRGSGHRGHLEIGDRGTSRRPGRTSAKRSSSRSRPGGCPSQALSIRVRTDGPTVGKADALAAHLGQPNHHRRPGRERHPDVREPVPVGDPIGDVIHRPIPARILGGAGNDVLTGNTGNDALDGQGGDDVLNGAGGNDQLSAGAAGTSCTAGVGPTPCTTRPTRPGGRNRSPSGQRIAGLARSYDQFDGGTGSIG